MMEIKLTLQKLRSAQTSFRLHRRHGETRFLNHLRKAGIKETVHPDCIVVYIPDHGSLKRFRAQYVSWLLGVPTERPEVGTQLALPVRPIIDVIQAGPMTLFALHEGEDTWIDMNSPCGFFGVSVASQVKRVSREAWGRTIVRRVQVPDDSQIRARTFIHEKSFNMWVATIRRSRVPVNVRAGLAQHQQVSALAVYEHMHGLRQPKVAGPGHLESLLQTVIEGQVQTRQLLQWMQLAHEERMNESDSQLQEFRRLVMSSVGVASAPAQRPPTPPPSMPIPQVPPAVPPQEEMWKSTHFIDAMQQKYGVTGPLGASNTHYRPLNSNVLIGLQLRAGVSLTEITEAGGRWSERNRQRVEPHIAMWFRLGTPKVVNAGQIPIGGKLCSVRYDWNPDDLRRRLEAFGTAADQIKPAMDWAYSAIPVAPLNHPEAVFPPSQRNNPRPFPPIPSAPPNGGS